MPCWKLTVAYDGTHFAGWQVQPGLRTVQSVFESVWQEITGETVRAIASGRTDAGVHAAGQVVGIESNTSLASSQLLTGLNAKLPEDLIVLEVEPTAAGFHATYDAVGKHYRYTIHNSRVPPLLNRHTVWHVPQQLDIAAMHRAAQQLVGTHDFCSFTAAQSKRNSMVRTVSKIDVLRGAGADAEQITFDVVGEGFLHNMVRIIVGTLVWIGQGTRSESWLAEVLAAHDRTAAGQTAPAQGLTLLSVDYG